LDQNDNKNVKKKILEKKEIEVKITLKFCDTKSSKRNDNRRWQVMKSESIKISSTITPKSYAKLLTTLKENTKQI